MMTCLVLPRVRMHGEVIRQYEVVYTDMVVSLNKGTPM